MAELIRSTKGNNKLSFNGYFYTKQYQKAGKIRWVCDQKRSRRCNGAVLTDIDFGNVNVTGQHNHVQDQGRIEIARVRGEMKSQAANTIAAPSAIQTGVLLQTDEEVKMRIGTSEACRQATSRARKKLLPVNPTTLNELVIEGTFVTTGGLNPERFLLHDNGPVNAVNSRIVIYSTDGKLRRLVAATRWYADGNFKLVPTIFKQLYIIRVRIGRGAYITAVYCFLENKTQVVYREMWRLIEHECQLRNLQINVEHLVIDFEQAVISAFHFVFGNHVLLHGCFFHLTQSTWRKVQSLGLTRTYIDNNEDFQTFVGMMDGLAFLPIDDIIIGTDFLRQNVHPHPRAVELLDYFEDTYVRGALNQQLRANNRPVRRDHPMFPPSLWNVHTATLNDDPRTNNVCESWNNSFFHIIGHNHPSMWSCIRGLQKQHADDEKVILQDFLGQQPRQRAKPALVQMQVRLRNLCIDYNLGLRNVGDFLRGVSHNIRFTL